MRRGRRPSQHQLELVLSQLPETIVWTTDEELRITSADGGGMALAGVRKPEELIGRTVGDLVGGDVYEAHRRALEGEGTNFTFATPRWAFDIHTEPLREGGVIGIAVNASKRRLAEEALVESEARFRTLVERLPICTYVNPLGFPIRCTYISPYIEKLLGFPVERWLTEDDFWVTRLHPDDRERVLEAANRTHETGEPFRGTYRMLHADGRAVTLLDETIPVSDEHDKPLFLQGFLLDIDS